MFVDHFNHFVIHDAKGLEFLSVIFQQGVQGGGGNGFDLAFVALLTVLAPETIEHHFGKRVPTWIFFRFSWHQVGCLPFLFSLHN